MFVNSFPAGTNLILHSTNHRQDHRSSMASTNHVKCTLLIIIILSSTEAWVTNPGDTWRPSVLWAIQPERQRQFDSAGIFSIDSPTKLEEVPPIGLYRNSMKNDEQTQDVVSTFDVQGLTMDTSSSISFANIDQQNNNQGQDKSSTLESTFGISNPLDRLLLTANGNMQRLVSSYYDAPVSVVVDYCEPIQRKTQKGRLQIKTTHKVWRRQVQLKIFGESFCIAKSEITVYDPMCQQLVDSGKVGLGQLFRYLDILPVFELLAAGTKEKGGLWRDYTLNCTSMSCRIHEDYCADLWSLPTSYRPLR